MPQSKWIIVFVPSIGEIFRFHNMEEAIASYEDAEFMDNCEYPYCETCKHWFACSLM